MSVQLRPRVYAVLLLAVGAAFAAPPADAAGVKVAFWNIKSGFGEPGLPGHTTHVAATANCTDASQPLNGWGVGVVQAALQAVKADPDIVALGLAEAWSTVCGSPENVRGVLGWATHTSEHNGVSLVARYGLAGPEQWQQLDTSLNASPTDTMWVLRVPVCVDPACTRSLLVYVAHWFGTDPNWQASYDRQAQQTAAYLTSTASGLPHVLVGDLNTWEGSSTMCEQLPNNASLSFLRGAGYLDAWLTVHGGAEGYTGMTNRVGCGVPEGYAWKRIDYAWTLPSYQPLNIQRFAVAAAGDDSASDHYGIVVSLPDSAPVAATPPPAPTSPTVPPPSAPVGPDDIVLYASRAAVTAGTWHLVPDATAAGGARMENPDAGAPKITTPLAGPASYFEMPFTARAGVAYYLWIRSRAQNDSWANDSVYVQFSGSLTFAGAPQFRIGTTSAAVYNLEEASGAGESGWGWQDDGYGLNVFGDPVYFDGTVQTIRIQQREDGISIDQIVLSPFRFASVAPGPNKNDATILPESPAAPTGPTPIVWTALDKVVATVSGIQKIGGCGDCFSAGAASQQSIASGQAVSFTVSPAQRLAVGLNHDAAADSGFTMDYAFSFWPGGSWEVREGGTYRTDGAASAGDVFALRIDGTTVRYYRNGVVVYTSKIPVAAPLALDASLNSIGAAVSNAVIK